LLDISDLIPVTNQGPHQHRWIREEAVIDVLIASNLGERSSGRVGVTGSTTISTIGAQGALNRSEKVFIQIGSRKGIINRPHLMGSIIMKCAAFSNFQDEARNRHLIDLLTLLSLVGIEDEKDFKINNEERKRITLSLLALEANLDILNSIAQSQEAITRFKLLIGSD